MIRIRTLGGLSVRRGDQALSGAATQPRRLAILALVARSGEQGITREQLLAMLWPDADETGRRALSQALHALRTDIDDDLFLGVQEVRLNLAAASCDVLDFETAVAAHQWERAATAYTGPFLQGFRLAGAPEFERWVEDERAHLAHRQADVLERLARGAGERGDFAAAVGWWRKRSAMDALNARVTLELMRALAGAGERHAAVQQARIYEALLEQELSLAPDADVVAYAEELRRALPPGPAGQPSSPPRPTPILPVAAAADIPTLPTAAPVAETFAPKALLFRPRARVAIATLLVVAAAGVLIALRMRRSSPPPPLLAVGAIVDYRDTAGSGPLTDMLATDLARIPGLQIVSTVRLLELMAAAGQSPTSPSYATAARRAGASDLMEGGLHAVPGGLLLHLRRVDLATGSVLGAWRVEGKDYFAVVGRVTEEVAASLGLDPTGLGAAQVGTSSLVAWRFYEEGLRGLARGDYRGARGLFEAALKEDSAFAMASYQWLRSRAILGVQPDSAQLAWLTRLAHRTNDRDRLQMLGWAAFSVQSPALNALADTLIVRYPADIQSQYFAGFARMARADFAAALPYLYRVIEADSARLGSGGALCLGCEALGLLTYALHALDSIPRAEQVARAWTGRDPRSAIAWATLASVLDVLGRQEEAIEARRKATPLNNDDNVFPAAVRLRAGDFAAADQVARALLAEGSDRESTWQGYFLLAISLRYQARWRELEELAQRQRTLVTSAERSGEIGRRLRVTDALTRLEAGRAAEAVRILDSMTRRPDPRQHLELTVQHTMLGEAAFVAGDPALLARAADSATAWARRSGKTRELGIATHARALSQLAQGDTLGAMRTFEQAIYSPTLGFTRTNYHLARLLLARGEARKAADLLRPALQGYMGTGNYYVTHTELHELLADAYARMGKTDSARVHWRWVAAALAQSDPGGRERYVNVVARLR